MKRVPMLAEEPTELAEWRAANSEDDGAAGANARDAWARFKASGAYRPLIVRLLARQQGLCGYCEQRLSDSNGSLVTNDYQVEHVLAKSGGSGRVLDWRNLMLCCGGGTWPHHRDPTRHLTAKDGATNLSCGQAKADADLEGPGDPRSLPWQVAVVRVDMDGRMVPDEDACRRARIDPAVLQHAIDNDLALNCERLRLAREDTVANLVRWLAELLEEILASSHLSADKRSQLLQLHVEGRLCPDRNGHLRRFWTTERLYLGEDAEAWIYANAALLHFDG